jgi:hypothetical protein
MLALFLHPCTKISNRKLAVKLALMAPERGNRMLFDNYFDTVGGRANTISACKYCTIDPIAARGAGSLLIHHKHSKCIDRHSWAR